MATNTDTLAPAAAVEDHPEGVVHLVDHPTERQYWKIFALLFVITAGEVLLYYVSIPGVNLNSAVLGMLAIAKFAIVVGYFMHLKFDNRIVRRLFVSGLLLAIGVYVAYLLTLGVFIDPPVERR